MFEVREVLRLWLQGESLRAVRAARSVDRKTVRRYVEAAKVAGVVRGSDEEQLHEALIGSAVEAVRPHRSDDPGEPWHLLVANHDQIMRCTRCPAT